MKPTQTQMDTISDNTSGMKPTQAQIERAAEHLMHLFTERGGPTYREMAETALTAAAEVGEAPYGIDMRTGKPLNERGWPVEPPLDAATIERCAQELAHLRQHEFGEADLFAAGFNEAIKQAQFRIRALKDML